MQVIDLFCGLGGWSTGAKRNGLEVAAALNHDATAIEFHSKAHPDTLHVQQDVAEVDWCKLAGHVGTGGLLLASPACQGFSAAGAPARSGTGGNGYVSIAKAMARTKGQRSTPWAIVAALEFLEPSRVVVENVPAFLEWGKFGVWRATVEAYGYSVWAGVLNASAYGGCTDRARAFVTLSRDGVLPLAESWGGRLGMVQDCLDADDFGGNRWSAIDSKPDRTRDLIRSRQASSGLRRGILNNVGDGVRMRDLSELAPTLTTQSGTQLMLVDGDRVRILNPGELARIMGWREGEIQLPSQRGRASKLIGNAIPVDLSEGIIQQVTA